MVHGSTQSSVCMSVNVGSGGIPNLLVEYLVIKVRDSTKPLASFRTWGHPSRYTGELLLK